MEHSGREVYRGIERRETDGRTDAHRARERDREG